MLLIAAYNCSRSGLASYATGATATSNCKDPCMPEIRLVKRRETAPGKPDRMPISAFPPLLIRSASRERRRGLINLSLVDSSGAVSGVMPSGTSTARESARRVARPSATSHKLPSRT